MNKIHPKTQAKAYILSLTQIINCINKPAAEKFWYQLQLFTHKSEYTALVRISYLPVSPVSFQAANVKLHRAPDER